MNSINSHKDEELWRAFGFEGLFGDGFRFISTISHVLKNEMEWRLKADAWYSRGMEKS
jgi:hypothetical protein